MADRLVLTGWADDARAWLPTFDVYALPSRNEGFPLALIEAMLARLPVVASDVGSVAEAVTREVGRLIPAGDVAALREALRELLGDAEERARLGATARERAVASFTDRAMAEGYEALYDQLSSRRVRGRDDYSGGSSGS
jgi:glycosyltransferase involved in cell wall biosynthesis